MKRENTMNLVSNFEIGRPMADQITGDKEAPLERDSKPMTAEELKKARRVPRVTSLRRALHMTQEQFAAEFGIPLGTLRDWEQGKSVPDATARAYLFSIAGDAKAVSKAHADGKASPFGL